MLLFLKQLGGAKMIRKEIISSLNEDELAMLLFIVNKIFPHCFEIDEKIITSYKYEAIRQQLLFIRDKVKDEYQNIWASLAEKLEIIEKKEIRPEDDVLEIDYCI